MTPSLRRVAEYGVAIRRGVHVRYLLALGVSTLIPRFTAGPLIARLYRLAGFRIGAGSSLVGPLHIVSGLAFEKNLVVGRDVLIATNVTINVDEKVVIEDSVSISPFVKIYTASHPIGPDPIA